MNSPFDFFVPMTNEKLSALRAKGNVAPTVNTGNISNGDVDLTWTTRLNNGAPGVQINITKFHSLKAKFAPQKDIINAVTEAIDAA